MKKMSSIAIKLKWANAFKKVMDEARKQRIEEPNKRQVKAEQKAARIIVPMVTRGIMVTESTQTKCDSESEPKRRKYSSKDEATSFKRKRNKAYSQLARTSEKEELDSYWDYHEVVSTNIEKIVNVYSEILPKECLKKLVHGLKPH